jgi:hypothetical protein
MFFTGCAVCAEADAPATDNVVAATAATSLLIAFM